MYQCCNWIRFISGLSLYRGLTFVQSWWSLATICLGRWSRESAPMDTGSFQESDWTFAQRSCFNLIFAFSTARLHEGVDILFLNPSECPYTHLHIWHTLLDLSTVYLSLFIQFSFILLYFAYFELVWCFGFRALCHAGRLQHLGGMIVPAWVERCELERDRSPTHRVAIWRIQAFQVLLFSLFIFRCQMVTEFLLEQGHPVFEEALISSHYDIVTLSVFFLSWGRSIKIAGLKDVSHHIKKLDAFPIKLQMVTAVWEDITLNDLFMLSEASETCLKLTFDPVIDTMTTRLCFGNGRARFLRTLTRPTLMGLISAREVDSLLREPEIMADGLVVGGGLGLQSPLLVDKIQQSDYLKEVASEPPSKGKVRAVDHTST